ncbi:GroES-like protein [Trichocladium antarcticum]|uniref:GroES-like protein n=1 Tax=Trichocladium antarcticum TaxID=1450529 RepID=A0AAN6UFT3_9PEZI|nr:GroES-like protein [Trichocladium antarcticum]
MASPLPASVPATHPAVAIIAPRQPLQLTTLPTVPPSPSEALVHVTWTASSPLELHRADGGLLLGSNPPFLMASTIGGTILALGTPAAATNPRLRVGDTVFGYVSEASHREAAAQPYATVPLNKLGKLPPNLALPAAVTVPTNLVSALHTLTADLGLSLPWPVPANQRGGDAPILVWGAASSVGLYMLQVLRHWGYGHVLAVASGKHHAELAALGARACFDYRRPGGVVEEITGYVDGLEARAGGARLPFIVDCIGSRDGSLRPLSRIAGRGSKVAVMLPVINVRAGKDRMPEYEMDVSKVLPGGWKDGVELIGVRTHSYAKNEFFRDHLLPEIVPALLEQGVVQPNKQRIVEGSTLLERAQNALDLLRDQVPSGEKLVWRVADEN